MGFSDPWNLSYHFGYKVVKLIVVFCKHLNTDITFAGGTGNITYRFKLPIYWLFPVPVMVRPR